MKKTYSQPEWKVLVFKTEDVITASGGGNDGVSFSYGTILNDEEVEKWGW